MHGPYHIVICRLFGCTVCDLVSSKEKRPWPALGRSTTGGEEMLPEVRNNGVGPVVVTERRRKLTGTMLAVVQIA